MLISQNENFVNTTKKTPEKQKLNPSRSAPPHKKPRAHPKYSANGCRRDT